RTARRLLHMDPAEARVPRQRVYARAVRGAAADVVAHDRMAAGARRGGVHIDRPVAAAGVGPLSALVEPVPADRPRVRHALQLDPARCGTRAVVVVDLVVRKRRRGAHPRRRLLVARARHLEGEAEARHAAVTGKADGDCLSWGTGEVIGARTVERGDQRAGTHTVVHADRVTTALHAISA